MAAKLKPKLPSDVEKLLYVVTLREMQTKSEPLREAYHRLAETASVAVGLNAPTIILDWLEAELRLMRSLGEGGKNSASELMTAAMSLASALKQ